MVLVVLPLVQMVNEEMITAAASEIEIIVPRKSDKIKIMAGASGKLISVDGTDEIVKVNDTLDMVILAIWFLFMTHWYQLFLNYQK